MNPIDGDANSDPIQLQESSFDGGELILPDGQTVMASTLTVDGCTVAAATLEDLIAVFIDGGFSFEIDEYIKILSPLTRCIAVTDAGYIAYHAGEHREKVFNLITWSGETVFQRVVETARVPTFTPDGNYVAFWRLTDNQIYCYDVTERADAGRFDTNELRASPDVGRAVNIGVEGVEYRGESAFKVSDTYGTGNDELLGYISPTGELIESMV